MCLLHAGCNIHRFIFNLHALFRSTFKVDLSQRQSSPAATADLPFGITQAGHTQAASAVHTGANGEPSVTPPRLTTETTRQTFTCCRSEGSSFLLARQRADASSSRCLAQADERPRLPLVPNIWRMMSHDAAQREGGGGVGVLFKKKKKTFRINSNGVRRRGCTTVEDNYGHLNETRAKILPGAPRGELSLSQSGWEEVVGVPEFGLGWVREIASIRLHDCLDFIALGEVLLVTLLGF